MWTVICHNCQSLTLSRLLFSVPGYQSPLKRVILRFILPQFGHRSRHDKLNKWTSSSPVCPSVGPPDLPRCLAFMSMPPPPIYAQIPLQGYTYLETCMIDSSWSKLDKDQFGCPLLIHGLDYIGTLMTDHGVYLCTNGT